MSRRGLLFAILIGQQRIQQKLLQFKYFDRLHGQLSCQDHFQPAVSAHQGQVLSRHRQQPRNQGSQENKKASHSTLQGHAGSHPPHRIRVRIAAWVSHRLLRRQNQPSKLYDLPQGKIRNVDRQGFSGLPEGKAQFPDENGVNRMVDGRLGARLNPMQFLLIICTTADYSWGKQVGRGQGCLGVQQLLMQKNNKNAEEEESNITVAIRIRPLSVKEQNSGDNDILRVQDNLIIVLDPLDAEIEEKKMVDVLHRSKEQRYAFDKIYRNHNNENIYFETTHPLIKTVLNGFNATVFAYGPTGTGKTYTMIGNQETFGLNVLAIRDIFYYIDKDPDNKYDVVITYVQIYNEMIRDLLVPSSGYLQLRDDPEKGIVIAGVTEFKAESTEQVMNLLLIGNRRRTTEATNANLTSSRSHAVFQISISKTSKTKNIKVESILGKLSLIDLAGSERGTVTENRGIRLMEGAKINRSLLALANCINALGDKNKKGFFVPYRDSKLTRLLKDSLGGNCKTVMIVNVSPSSSQFQETINTLKYANRAKNIKTKAITNKKLVALHISQYKNIINDLHREIEELKIRLSENRGLENRQNYENKDKLPRIESRHGKNNTVGSDGVCTYCGRIDEKEDIKSIKEQIFQNFNERIQLRRAMMEIEEQNALNVLQMRKKSGEIAFLKKNQGWEDNAEISSQIKEMTKVIQTLKLSTNKNMLKKEITNLQIMESMAATKKIREDIMRKIRSKENRDTLEIIIKNHVLELQNIELEINLQIQERMITDMRQIILTQKSILEENGIQSVQGEEELPGPDEIEIELEQQDQAEESQENNQDEEMFDNFEDAEIESYKNFEFGKNKYMNRNHSAKKDLSEKRNRREDPSFKKKEAVRDKSMEKPQPQLAPPINDFSLKGLKMNVKKKK